MKVTVVTVVTAVRETNDDSTWPLGSHILRGRAVEIVASYGMDLMGCLDSTSSTTQVRSWSKPATWWASMWGCPISLHRNAGFSNEKSLFTLGFLNVSHQKKWSFLGDEPSLIPNPNPSSHCWDNLWTTTTTQQLHFPSPKLVGPRPGRGLWVQRCLKTVGENVAMKCQKKTRMLDMLAKMMIIWFKKID